MTLLGHVGAGLWSWVAFVDQNAQELEMTYLENLNSRRVGVGVFVLI